ncbi:MAG: T9SS type A sorting domain-containing protein [Sphingobacteriales bacterium JAD_PAG50586_3]|nr:MAG: T9SS type A sorting domain-containing protein [Sphingobacteriales bacterium JAD_PAG50586_3]
MHKYLTIIACVLCLFAFGQQPLGGPCTGPPATPGPISGESSTCNFFDNDLQYCVDGVPGATSYTWSVTPINSATVTVNNQCILLDIDAVFWGDICIEVRANNECGSSLFSNCFNLTVYPIPQPTITIAPDYCLVDEDFPIVVSPAGGTFSGCVQSAIINPADIGVGTCIINYSVTVNGCEGTTFEEVIINPAINVNANASGITTLCEGGLPLVVTGAPQGGSYTPSNWIDTYTPGEYIFTYNIAGQNGCSGSDTDTITVISLPYVSFDYDVNCDSVCIFNITSNSSYTIDFGDGSIATGNCHWYSADSTYCITLTATNQCGESDTTVCITISCTGINENAVEQLSLYPNPTNGLVNVSFTSAKAQNYTLNVVDVTGKVLHTESLANFVGPYNNPIDFSRFATGMYIFRIVGEDGRSTNVKVIRE